jgi:hypothetical protein
MTTRAAHITQVQSEELAGQLYAEDSRFNPFQDVNGNWCISDVEVRDCVTIPWVNDLDIVEVELPDPIDP